MSVNSHHFHDFHEIHWFPWNHHEIIKSADFAVLVRNSMLYRKRACGYMWIRLYIVSPTAPAAKGATFGHENHKSQHFYGISWKLVKIMIFMEKCESHIKSTRKQPSAPEAENSSNSCALLHGSEAARVLLEPGWWKSPNSTYFSRIPPFWWNLVKFGDFWCLGGGNLAFTRSTMKTQSILCLFRWFLAQIGTFH